MSDCNHNHETQRWVEDYYDAYYDLTETAHWETVTESACEDISLHSYSCTICGKVMSYGDNF